MKKIDQEKGEFLEEIIKYWEEENLLNEATANKLRQSYEAKVFDWRRLAQYSFWVAMACGVISLGALLIDKTLLNYIQKLYNTPNSLISLFSALAAIGLFILGFKRKKTKPQQIFSNEALVFTAVMLTANAIAYFGKSLNNGSNHFSILILLSVVIYAGLAYLFKSRLIWVFTLLSFGAWFGTETGYLSRWSGYFIGLNYPLRFVLFGFILTAASYLLKQKKNLQYFFPTTYVCGMAYLFISLWLLSVFGNFGTLESWYTVKQISLFYWAIISAIVCVVSIFVGLKYHDEVAREVGITFLFINLYSRYFEYFWDSWHKALFFSVLAISFWLIGRKAEKIWNVEFTKK
ncbi:DUF2157 domain-containing protein [Pedobacter sp. LMG 31464]|uniref:DUF2157 domain-containing protein n=1 Tax=Pedobacter planticolens TaxID=2679964 RepID=A0A923ISS8_9SPHI|nr:DUF2157 domain-containing protein [Pedobacter planticolens]MBB2143880.1 DUF2157 domain-containing protein [Pedobacter planticolens]